MNPKYSLVVSFLLHLKGVFVQTDSVSVRTKSVCAPTGSSVTLWSSCKYPDGYIFQSLSWTHRSNDGETVADPRKDSRYIYRNYHHNSDLTINDLKETDAGTYYMSFTYRKGNLTFNSIIPSELSVLYVTALQVTVDSERVTEGQKVTLTCKTSCPATAGKRSFIWWKNERRLNHSRDALPVSAVSREDSGRYSCALESFESRRSAETLLGVSPPDVVKERAGIVTLPSLLLTLIALLLICAALWMMIRKKRQSLKRPEGKEKLTQDSTLAATFDLEEEGKSVHQEEVQYSHVHFCKFPNAQQSCAKEADVLYSEIALPSTEQQKNCRI